MKQGERKEELAELLKQFPGVGQRQAERFASFLVRSGPPYIARLIESIQRAHKASHQCPQCFIRHESAHVICSVCEQNTPETLIIVEKDIDAYSFMDAMENSAVHYFVLGGLIPIANNETKSVRLSQLLQQIATKKPREVVIAFSVHPDADHTTRFLVAKLQDLSPTVPVSVLGRGLSSGLELEYADPDTLKNALKKRDGA